MQTLSGFHVRSGRSRLMWKQEGHMREKVLHKTRRFDGKVVTLEHWLIEKPDGKQGVYEVLLHPGASACIPVDEEGNVYLVRQDRIAIGRDTLEIPAGKLEPGEDPLEAAKRELEEETGLSANNWKHLVSQYPAAAYDQEIVHIYLATGLHRGTAHPDEDEWVSVEVQPLEQLFRRVMNGELQDSKTVTAILMAHSLLCS